MEQRQWAIVTIAGGIAIAIGSVLPWVNLTSGLVGTISMAGTEGDGILTLGAGIIVALLGAAAYARGSKTAAAGTIAMSLAAGYVAVQTLFNLSENTGVSEGIRSSIGMGLWITLAGVVVGLVGGVMAARGIEGLGLRSKS